MTVIGLVTWRTCGDAAMSMPSPALGLRFTVSIDGIGSLGNWAKCEGLTVEYDVMEYQEGGQNACVHRIPGRAKYQNIRLTRPVDSTPPRSSRGSPASRP